MFLRGSEEMPSVITPAPKMRGFELCDYMDTPKQIICDNGTQWKVGDSFLNGTIACFTPVRSWGNLFGYLAKGKDNNVIGLIFLSGAIISGGVTDA